MRWASAVANNYARIPRWCWSTQERPWPSSREAMRGGNPLRWLCQAAFPPAFVPVAPLHSQTRGSLRPTRAVAPRRPRYASAVNGHVDRLDLLVIAEAIFAELATPAGLLEATEGRGHVEVVEAVDPDGAGAQGMRGAQSLADVPCAEARRQAILCVVGTLDGIAQVLVLQYAHDRPEDLLLRDSHAVVHIPEDCGLNEVARVGCACAASQNFGAFSLALLNVPHDLVKLYLVHDGTLHRVRRCGVPDLPTLGGLGRRGRELLIDVLMHEEPRTGAAALAMVQEEPNVRGRNRLLDVRVRQHDQRRLTTQLQRNLFQVALGRALHDLVAHGTAAGESDLVHIRMKGQWLPSLRTITVEHVHHARRDACLLD
mmetsp:Transcript_61958/g.192361  ORF Transcript_61958/g.192361 Transcript_61958/m.192361 type:complete len:371 (-) Transcript_61958:220-1332(-)